MNGKLLAQLIHQLFHHAGIPHDFDSDTGGCGIVGCSDSQGFNIVAFPGEKTGNLRKNAGGVFHENGEGMAGIFVFHILYLLNPAGIE